MLSSLLPTLRKRQDQLRRKLLAYGARRALARAGRAPRLPLKFRSQYGEDVLAWLLLGRPLEGFFVEVGAFDGLDLSVTYALEAMGWRGLLIEPIPQRYEKCKALRTHSTVVNTAVGSPTGVRESNGSVTFTITSDQFGGMMSFVGATAEGEHARKTAGMQRTDITVPLTTVAELLARPGVLADGQDVDLAVIDVEGHEVPLLEGFDLARYRPKLMIIEDNTGAAGANALTQCMGQYPYTQLCWLKVNRVYARNDQVAAMRARLPGWVTPA